jgi:PAS domain-containing protein
MESGLIALAWPAAALLLVVVAGLAFAFFRLRTRLAQMALGHAGIERIIEQANDGILVLDFVSGKLHHANPRIARMLGYSLERYAIAPFSTFIFRRTCTGAPSGSRMFGPEVGLFTTTSLSGR